MSVSSSTTSSSPNRIDSCLTKEEVQHALDVFCETDCEDLYKSVRPDGMKMEQHVLNGVRETTSSHSWS